MLNNAWAYPLITIFEESISWDYADPSLPLAICKSEVETLQHLFIQCRYVAPLWVELEKVLSYKFSDAEKLLGVFKEIGLRSFDIHSHAGIILKYYVHICRLNEIKPDIHLLNKRIRYTEFLEKSIAKRKGKLGKHYKKWRTYFD